MSSYHRPVMAAEVVKALTPLSPGTVLDGTVGGGGHALAILEAFPEATLLGTDRDPQAIAEAETALAGFDDRVRLVRSRLDTAVQETGVVPGSLSGIVLDLGLSSHQIDDEARGFAFRRGVALDMRMDGANRTGTAADFLNQASESELSRVFREYGDVTRSGRLARTVCRRRERSPFRTSDDLVGALAASLGRAPSAREKARVFQAVRIAINEEVESLTAALPELMESLAPGGTIVVIAYHSIEDRLVKHTFREWSRDCVCPPGLPVCACRGHALGTTLTRKPVSPAPDEVAANPRARSARLRAWRKAA